jgi:Prenyltransferase and squalene oxidase repeat
MTPMLPKTLISFATAAAIVSLAPVASRTGAFEPGIATTTTAQDAGEPILPKHVTPQTVRAVERGIAYLRKAQSSDGSFSSARDGSFYPVAMAGLAGMALLASGSTTTRGPAADEIARTVRFLMGSSRSSGLIAGQSLDSGRPMHGHGFALLFLATAQGMETDRAMRERLAPVIKRAVRLVDSAQSDIGGWTYTPGSGDEGSVTVTQIQALRAADAAGFTVPERTLKRAVRYLELCQCPDGGIRYSYRTPQGTSRPPISAAAVATLYNAGDYDSPLAKRCLEYISKQMLRSNPIMARGRGGHAFYMNLYAAQAFYQAGDKEWDQYYPPVRDALVGAQAADGSWEGDDVGPIYGTSIALIILQLPYKFLPVYQR